MSSNGAGDLLVQARSALLDALTALWEHRDSVVVIGAQAIYLHTGAVGVALAEATKNRLSRHECGSSGLGFVG